MPNFPRITVHAGAYLALAFLLMIMELNWICAFILSAAIHELFHIAMLSILKCHIHEISIGMTGAKIVTAPLSRKQEFLCSLSGPVGGMLPILLAAAFPRLALCAFFHSFCNLIPLYPLDGGRALRCIVPKPYLSFIELPIIVLLLAIGIHTTGWLGIIVAFVVIVRPLAEKYLAKNRPSGYNIATIK